MDSFNVIAGSLAGLPGLAGMGFGSLAWRFERPSRVVDVIVQAKRRVPEPPRRRARRAIWIGGLLVVGAAVALAVPPRFAALPILVVVMVLEPLRARAAPEPVSDTDPTWVSSSPPTPGPAWDPQIHPPLRRDFDRPRPPADQD